ncbi:hypothetical protein [Paenibacillus psychroresistens]|nr:hypothetical protein [Paenibacillus psychroresistens]
MRDREEPYQEDPMAVGRGMVFGVVFGTILWTFILVAIWYWVYN